MKKQIDISDVTKALSKQLLTEMNQQVFSQSIMLDKIVKPKRRYVRKLKGWQLIKHKVNVFMEKIKWKIQPLRNKVASFIAGYDVTDNYYD